MQPTCVLIWTPHHSPKTTALCWNHVQAASWSPPPSVQFMGFTTSCNRWLIAKGHYPAIPKVDAVTAAGTIFPPYYLGYSDVCDGKVP